MFSLVRPLLFRLEPEKAHALTLSAMRLAGRLPPIRALLQAWFAVPDKPVKAFGLSFKNPVGLAAGYDKDGTGWRGLASLGFGHIEIGTVTPKPQEGNPQPRLFRLIEDGAFINRMGFPGKGARYVRGQLQGCPRDTLLGVNLGKNKNTPLEAAVEDYLFLMETFAPLADYLAINVSSPNTTGLRRLQSRKALEGLLGALAERRESLNQHRERQIPVLVKLAPDLEDSEIDQALEAILNTGMDGVIATNTTVGRHALRSPWANETGGLSGAPLRACSTQMIYKIRRRMGGRLSIIGVGGIMNERDAKEKLEAGADLVQVYTGLVYGGPGLVKRIVRSL